MGPHDWLRPMKESIVRWPMQLNDTRPWIQECEAYFKRTSAVCHPESESQQKIALDTEQDPIPHPSVSHGGSSASGTRPSIATSADLNTDMTREVRAGPAPDVTRASGEDQVGGDVVMREDENNGGHPSTEGRTADEGSQRRGNHVKSEMSDRTPPNSTFRGGSWERRRLTNKLWLSPRKRHWTVPARTQ